MSPSILRLWIMTDCPSHQDQIRAAVITQFPHLCQKLNEFVPLAWWTKPLILFRGSVTVATDAETVKHPCPESLRQHRKIVALTVSRDLNDIDAPLL